MKQENQPDPPRPGSLSSGTAGVRHFNQILMMAMMMMVMMMAVMVMILMMMAVMMMVMMMAVMVMIFP